jgi:cobalt/nickel transport system permease protein
VLIVQCFLFADGGLLALGANILNMGLINSIAGGAIYQALRRLLPGEAGRLTAIAFAGWSAAVLAAMVCAGELAWSGTVAWSVGFPAMASVHMLIGLGEGLISALVLLAVQRTRPDLLPEAPAPLNQSLQPAQTSLGQWCAYGFVAALGVALFVAPFACPWPDGLDHVAAQLGFDRQQTSHPAPVAGYQMPGVHWAVGATAAAGGAGTVIVFGLAWVLGRALTRKDSSRA